MSGKCRYTEVAAIPTARATELSDTPLALPSAVMMALAASSSSSRSFSPCPRGFRRRVRLFPLVTVMAWVASLSSAFYPLTV